MESAGEVAAGSWVALAFLATCCSRRARSASLIHWQCETKPSFLPRALTRRSVQFLVDRFVKIVGLDPAVTVHSFRVTALTTARERGCDIIDLQDFAGHCDPQTTLTYIRNRDRLSKSPAYVLNY